MKNVIINNNEKTTLFVSPDKIELIIGDDLDKDKLQPFLDFTDELTSGIASSTYYGHFKFSGNKMEVTLSHRADVPTVFDLTYDYEF